MKGPTAEGQVLRRAVDGQALSKLLADHRALLDPVQFGCEPRRSGSGRRAKGVPQALMDDVLSWPEGIYSKFERGQVADPERASAAARALRLGPQAWAAMWSFLFGQEPPFLLDPNWTALVGAHWQNAIEGQHMTVVMNPGWDLLLANRRMARMFPDGEVPANLMEWMLMHPDARERVLLGWETWWAPRLLMQLRAAFARHRHHPSLIALVEQVRQDPLLAPIYKAAAFPFTQPDGDRRPMCLVGRPGVPGQEEDQHGWLTVAVSYLAGNPDARQAILMFEPDDQAGL